MSLTNESGYKPTQIAHVLGSISRKHRRNSVKRAYALPTQSNFPMNSMVGEPEQERASSKLFEDHLHSWSNSVSKIWNVSLNGKGPYITINRSCDMSQPQLATFFGFSRMLIKTGPCDIVKPGTVM